MRLHLQTPGILICGLSEESTAVGTV